MEIKVHENVLRGFLVTLRAAHKNTMTIKVDEVGQIKFDLSDEPTPGCLVNKR